MKTKLTTMELYRAKAAKAKELGFDYQQVVGELNQEITRIKESLKVKLIQLTYCMSPYPAREAKRIAKECIDTITKLCAELEKEESKI